LETFFIPTKGENDCEPVLCSGSFISSFVALGWHGRGKIPESDKSSTMLSKKTVDAGAGLLCPETHNTIKLIKVI
jgi:hypothetical protein